MVTINVVHSDGIQLTIELQDHKYVFSQSFQRTLEFISNLYVWTLEVYLLYRYRHVQQRFQLVIRLLVIRLNNEKQQTPKVNRHS